LNYAYNPMAADSMSVSPLLLTHMNYGWLLPWTVSTGSNCTVLNVYKSCRASVEQGSLALSFTYGNKLY